MMKTSKKVCAVLILLSAIMILQCIPFTVSGEESVRAVGYSSESVVISELDGVKNINDYSQGAEDTAYKITDAQGLKKLSQIVNGGESLSGKTVYLANNISMKSVTDFMPIGSNTVNGTDCTVDSVGENYFSGIFDGQGYRINDLAVTVGTDGMTTSSDGSVVDAGLFGVLRDATVKNLIIGESCSFSSLCTGDGNYTGGIAARVVNSGTLTTTIQNVYVKARLSGNVVGGIVGRSRSNTTHIINCTNKANIDGDTYLGGMIGHIRGVTYVTNCRNIGEFSSDADVIGGMVGRQDGNRLFATDCVNNSSLDGEVSGGILGYALNAKTTQITDCKSFGKLTGTTVGAMCAYAGADGTNTYSIQIDDTTYSEQTVPKTSLGSATAGNDSALSEEMLGVGLQVELDKSVASEQVKLRLLSSIDSIEQYKYAGFAVKYTYSDGSSTQVSDKKVYTAYSSIISGSEIGYADEIFSPLSEYFFVLEESFAKKDFTVIITAKPFIVTNDGARIEGMEISFRLSDYMESIGVPTVLGHGVVGRVTDDESSLQYQAWSTTCVDENGVMYTVCSGNRLEHIDPFGEVWMYKSVDGGTTWTEPKVIVSSDKYLDYRDSGITYLGNGRMMIAYFNHSTSMYTDAAAGNEYVAWQDELDTLYNLKKSDVSSADVIEVWNGMSAEEKEGGAYVIYSDDYGETWGEPSPTPIFAPHGPTVLKKDFEFVDGDVLPEGTLIYVGKSTYAGPYKTRTGDRTDYKSNRTYTIYSTDNGQTWIYLSENEYPVYYNADTNVNVTVSLIEPHVIQIPNGDLFAVFRTQNTIGTEFELYTATLKQGAGEWTKATGTGIDGVPAHLLVMSNDVLLMTYGKRTGDYGECARISIDGGNSWGEEIRIRTAEEGVSKSDIGYPTTVQLADGSLVTVYYEPYASDEGPSILYTKWEFKEN